MWNRHGKLVPFLFFGKRANIGKGDEVGACGGRRLSADFVGKGAFAAAAAAFAFIAEETAGRGGQIAAEIDGGNGDDHKGDDLLSGHDSKNGSSLLESEQMTDLSDQERDAPG